MNILGQPFSSWVTEQIKVRQTSLGNSTNLTNTNLISQYSKTPWIRLASTVNIEEITEGNFKGEGTYNKLASYGIDKSLISGDQVARNFMLFGGTSKVDSNNTASFNAGLNTENALYNGAYGWGGIEERGYVPMPGITDASVQYYNNGALSKATINMKCYSRNQLALLDVLYMRPGYNLLLEFGHTMYLDNEGQLQKFDNFITDPLGFVLNPTSKASDKPTHFDVFDLIQKERKERFGNYEAVFGKVTNFNWSFNPDGSYDCSTILTGMGDMMESLKVNIKLPSKAEKDAMDAFESILENLDIELPPIVANRNKTTFNKVLYSLYSQTNKTSETDTYFNVKLPNCPLAQCEVETDGTQKTKFGKEELVVNKGMLAVQNVTTDGEENVSPQVYITFGCLLALIQKYLLVYDKNGAPLFDFDVDFKDLANDDNYIVKLPGSFSADPLTCLIPYTNVSEEVSTTIQVPDTDLNIKLKESSFIIDDNPYLGRLMHVYLNANKLVEIFNSSPRDTDGSLSLLSFMNSVIREFTRALGGINMISIKVDEDKGKIVFIEGQPQRFSKEESTESLAMINTFGVKPDTEGSFVRNIVMGGEISSQFASMIAIGSQIQGNKLTANATGFSKYNLGLVDRVIPQKENADEFSNEDDKPEKTIDDLWTQQMQNPQTPTTQNPGLFVGTYQLKMFITENINALVELNNDWTNLISGKLVEKKQLQSPFFLPFNLSLDLDGISGIKLFEKFTLDDRVMPPSYGEGNIDLLVKSLNHQVSPASWLTQIDTQAAPRSKMSAIKAPKPLVSTTVKQVPASSGGSRVPVGELGDYKSLTSGFPMAKIYYDGPSPKNQIYLHHTAGATKSPSKTIRSWSKRTDRVSTHYITNNLGDKEQLYPDEAWGNHLGIKKSTFTKYGLPWKHLNKFSLGIEMQSYGYLTKKGDKYITAYGNAVPADTVAQPVDKNGNPIAYKGKKYYQKYNAANIAHVKDIVTGWMSKYNIPFVYDYDELFPNSGDPLSKKALGGEAGVYTHNSVKTGKSDVFPQKELLDMLKSIATSIKS